MSERFVFICNDCSQIIESIQSRCMIIKYPKISKNDLFNKIDIILFGQETIGSAERSCNVEEMRNTFYTIENGGYAGKLFELFGKERVEAELEEFFALDFFPRYGAGIGLTRLARAMELLIEEKQKVAEELNLLNEKVTEIYS